MTFIIHTHSVTVRALRVRGTNRSRLQFFPAVRVEEARPNATWHNIAAIALLHFIRPIFRSHFRVFRSRELSLSVPQSFRSQLRAFALRSELFAQFRPSAYSSALALLARYSMHVTDRHRHTDGLLWSVLSMVSTDHHQALGHDMSMWGVYETSI